MKNENIIDLAGKAEGVSVRGVNLSYGDFHALKDVSLEIQKGEFFAFLGPSGCGKTTLLRLIAGFNKAQTGSVHIGGADITNQPPWGRDVGMVFQSYALWPHMSVAQNVAFGLEERKLPRSEIKERVRAALELVGLSHLAQRHPSQLSGGQQQRIALARTIVVRPKVLLLDEPLSNLDAKLRVQMRRELTELQRDLNLTTIFVTHDQEEANTMCDRIAVMHDGVIQQVGRPMDIYDNPVNMFVANFLGTANIFKGEVRSDDAGHVFISPGIRPIPLIGAIDSRATHLMFRPQNVTLREAPQTGSNMTVALEGTISHREFLGATIRYLVKLGEQDVHVDQPHHTGESELDPGTHVTLDLAYDKVRLLSE